MILFYTELILTSSFDISSAGVVGNAFAHHHDGLLDFSGRLIG